MSAKDLRTRCFNLFAGNLRIPGGWRVVLFSLGLGAGLCLLPVSAVTVTTTNGAGADRVVMECNYTGTTTNSLDSASAGTDTQLNGRWYVLGPTNINEVIALRFDLTGNSLPACTNFQLQLFNHRTNSARILHYYGVVNGAGGANNNGTVTNWTDNDWSESSPALKFSTMPGVHYDGVASTKGFSNTVDLGSATINAINEGTFVTFSSGALDSFIQSHPNELVTLLVGVDTSSSGQSRFCSKETTATATSVFTGATGDFAPRLSFSIVGAPAAGIYFQQQPTDASAGSVLAPAVTVAATNSVGAPASNVLVTLSLLSGAGPLNGTLSQTTDSSGLATFTNLSLTVAGGKQLLATAGSLTTTSACFTISAGPAAALSFSTQPGEVRINSPIKPPVVVQLHDAYGNNVASNGVAIMMGLTSGTGTLSGNTNIATSAGAATFTNLSINSVGTKALTASHPGLTSAVSASCSVTNAVPAFPGAQGAGAYALGARGGDVYYVTSLSDANTSGTLRYGINNAPSTGRTILFKVSGNIALNSTLAINKPRITIAGQTAPGDGICLQNYSFNIGANDVIIRHLRTRLGTNALQEADAMWINSGTNIVVDHVSASWSVDETLSASASVANLTVQNCFITESLQNSIHAKGAHGYGGIISASATTTYTYLRNLYAHHDSRNPRLASSSQSGILRLDFRNNVIYNWGFRAGYSGGTNETTELNYVGNYLIAGPSSTYNYAFLSGGDTTSIFQSGNFFDTDKNGLVNGTNSGWSMFAGTMTQMNAPFDVPEVDTEAAGTACQRVLSQSGAMPWRRDAYDQRMASTVRRQNGQLVDFVCPTNFTGDYVTNNIGGTNYIGVNPWPTLTAAIAPVDSDSDGMPDFWEAALGLATNNVADRNLTNELGYTRLEDYLNWLADPHTLCHRNGYVDFDLRAANGGAKNLVFVLANGTNGTVTLLGDGCTARFTATNHYSGLANFTYAATDPANGLSFGPDSVGVLITTTNAPTISEIADQVVSEDSVTAPIRFTVGDAETPAEALTVSGSSSNPSLVPDANIIFGGSGADRSVTLVPAANQFGSTTITVTVSNGSLTASRSFVLTVSAVNDPPTISGIADRTVTVNTTTGPISFTVGDVDNPSSSLAISGSSSNPTLVPNGNITFGGSGVNRTVTVTPAADQHGSATITAVVSDGSSSAQSSFNLTVIAPPSITTRPQSQTVIVGSNATFSVTATGSEPLSYQWRFNGADIAGATGASYTVANAQLADAGEYSVVVVNAVGSVISAPASLTVNVNALFSGRATVLEVDILDVTNAWSDTGALPPEGGALEASLLTLHEPELFAADVAHASVIGQGDRTQSEASAANFALNIGGVTLGADFLMAQAQAIWQTNGTAVSASSEIEHLVVNGLPVVVTGETNQVVPLVNGALTINEQTRSETNITVKALHIILNGVADVVISSAEAGLASLAMPAPAGTDYVTGGGWITGTPSGAKGNFGLSAGLKDDALYFGHLTYKDHGSGMKVKGTGITGYWLGATPNERRIEGTAEIDGVAGYTYTVDVADNGEPGRGNDVFFLTLSNGHQAGGTLGGGNIQPHKSGE